jgi:hypothetical protein
MKFQTKHAIAPVAGYVGAKTRAVLNTMGGTTGGTGGVIVPTGTNVSVALSYDNPASGTIISGQAIADLAHFTFSNPTGTEAKVTNLVFARTGVSNDITLSNIYLYNGGARLTDAAAVSNGKITFNDSSGLFTIPAGGMKTIAVKADIYGTNTSGQIIGVSLSSAKSGATDIAGAYPVVGNNHSIASSGTIAAASWGTVVNPSTTPELQVGLVMWQDNVTISERSVNLSNFTLRQIGSVGTSDLASFQLFIDGVQFGATVPAMDANGYVTFTSATPKLIATGSHTIKMVGDIVGGSTKTFSWHLQQASDAAFVDSQLGATILSTVGTAVFSDRTTTTSTINSTTGGSLSIVKATDSPSGNVVLNGSNVLLAKYTLKAIGESMKIETIDVGNAASTSATYTLRNGALYADGAQVGSTKAIKGGSTPDTAFTLGSSLIVVPGTPVTLEVRADIYNSGTTGGTLVAGYTIQAEIMIPANGYKKMASQLYNSSATSEYAGTELTVASGSISGSKNSSYGSRTVVKPQTAYKIGSFTVTAADSETINLNTVNVDFVKASAPSVGLASGDVTDLYVVYGTKQTTTKTTADVTTVSTSANAFSINETLAPNASMTFDIYGTLNTSIGDNDTVITSLYVSGLTADSGETAAITEVSGQTISFASGTMSAAVTTDSEIKLLVGNTTPKIASFRFTAINDTFTLTDMGLTVEASQNGVDAIAAGAIRNFVLKSSGMADKIVTLTSATTATSTGMTLTIPANDSNGKTVDVYAYLNDVGISAATSSANVKVTLASYKSRTSTGEIYNGGGVFAAGQNQYVMKSIPTIALVSLPSTVLQAGTQTLSKFSITPDAAGTIGWKQLIFSVAKSASGPTITGTSTLALYRGSSCNTLVTGTFATSTIVSQATEATDILPANSGKIHFVAGAEQELSATETYCLTANVQGTLTSKYITTSIAAPSGYVAPNAYANIAGTFGTATNPSLVWTDRSSNSHGVTTPDWDNDYKVLNLPTATQTLTGSS